MNNFIYENLKKLKLKKFLTPELDLRILLNNSKKIKKELFLSNFDQKDINLKKLNFFIKKRLQNQPISKILKKKNFWKYEFFVNKNVLDPRPESELIIEESLSAIKDKNKKINILDIGTGSGCLSVCLANEFINSTILGIDISQKAINVAKKNVELHSKYKNIILKKADINIIKNQFDLIVSNPPYLSEEEYRNTSIEIKKYEPKIAFIGGKDGLKFYRVFSKKLPNLLKHNGLLLIEIGENQLLCCKQIFKNCGLKLIKITKDYAKKDRILIFSKI